MKTGKRLLATLLVVIFSPLVLPALWMQPHAPAAQQEEPVDSLVSLLSAQSVQLIEKDGINYRKVTGPARFLHNNTYLICDTALWNVSQEQIDAIGHVKILQNETVLTSDRLIYLIPEDLAQFRGTLVQLEDKDHNVLRTRHLDYNTKDSVAVFQGGGAMRDSDGQIIESQTGTYDSKAKLFTFVDNVNMFTDSIFVKTTRLEYRTDLNLATFGAQTDAWRDDDMLSSNAGWYDRNRELFLFYKDVHGLTDERESWSDSMYFWRNRMDVEMLGHVQLTDTVQNVSAVAGRIFYEDSLSRVILTRDPAIVGLTERGEGQKPDSAYVGADTLIYLTRMMFQIPEGSIKVSEERIKNLDADAISAYRRKAAEEAAKAAEEARMKDPVYAAEQAAKKRAEEEAKKAAEAAQAGVAASAEAPVEAPVEASVDVPGKTPEEVPEALAPPTLRDSSAVADSLSVPADSLSVPEDSLPVPEDSLPAADSPGAADSVAVPDGAEETETEMVVPVPLDSAAQARADSLMAIRRQFLADSTAHADSLMAIRKQFLADSTARADSIRIADSLALIPKDSTKIGYLTAIRNVRLWRRDIQMVGDSLEYCDLDSLVRLYQKPVIWNEVRHQYTADSLHIRFRQGQGGLDKAYFMSEAFIIIQEDSLAFDQIRSAEMLAYFDQEGNLRRFDALGDADAIFYLQEDSTFATVNKSKAKMLMAEFKDGDIDRVLYFDQIKNDAHPLAQLRKEETSLKGFDWQPDLRPRSPRDVTAYKARKSERSAYRAHPRTSFKQTDLYFPGYMKGVYKSIKDKEAARERRARERELRQQFLADSIAQARMDSIDRARLDSLHIADSLKAAADSLKAAAEALKAAADSLKAADSLGVLSDSLAAGGDSLGTGAQPVLPAPDTKVLKAQERARKKQLRDSLTAARNAAREARWAMLDSLDAAKEQAKLDKKAAKARDHKRKVILAEQRQAAKDLQKLERYRQQFLRRKAREDARKARAAARKLARASRAPHKPTRAASPRKAGEESQLLEKPLDPPDTALTPIIEPMKPDKSGTPITPIIEPLTSR